jgi:phytanoyl-CoA hydroxylase
MSRMELSDEQIQHYRREGYLVVDRFLSFEMLAQLDRTIREISERAIASGDWKGVLEVEPESGNGQLVARRIYSPFDQHEDFRAVATDSRLLDAIEDLIGPNITLQHSKLNMKPAKIGSSVEWHQDMAYFPHTNDDLVTTLIYLDDATVENGCLQVLPRHHTHFFNHALPDGTFAGMITEDLDTGRFGTPISLAAPAGSVIFMHCITPHSSLPNRSQHGRRTLIFEYRAADSFPIYFSEMTTVAESKYRLLRGRPATHARLAGPAPLVPQIGKFASLYELQAQSKEALVANGRSA